MRADHTPDDSRVFVFGSNVLGIHGAGSARYASKMLGAEHGVGEGITGSTYALPTCSRPGVPMMLDEVRSRVMNFIAHACETPGVTYYVSAVGCGIAGALPTNPHWTLT